MILGLAPQSSPKGSKPSRKVKEEWRREECVLGWLGRWVRVRRAKTGTILPYVLALSFSAAAASIPLWEFTVLPDSKIFYPPPSNPGAIPGK